MLQVNGLFLLLQCRYLFILFFHFHFPSFFFLFLFITIQPQYSQCSINLQCFTYRACSFISNVVPCSFVLSFSLPSFSFCSYSSQRRFSSVNVVLTFIASLIALAPSAPMLLPVHLFFLLLFPSFLFILIQHFSDPVQSM